MERPYRTLRWKVRRYLKSEQRKKTWVGRNLSGRVFDERHWRWRKRSVALGAGWGAVCAILPVPMQMLWGIAFCLWKKGNVPVAVLMAWLSPPGSFFVVVPLQWWLGYFILSHVGLDGSGANVSMVQDILSQQSLAPLGDLSFSLIALEFLTGLGVSCALLGLSAYAVVYGIWSLVDYMKDSKGTIAPRRPAGAEEGK